jgi:hypothetical protein
MTEQEINEQAKKAQELAQEQIFWTTMLFIIAAFVLGWSLNFVSKIIPQALFGIVSVFIGYQLVDRRVKYSVNYAFEKIGTFWKNTYTSGNLVKDQTEDFLSLVEQELGYDRMIEEPFLKKKPELRGRLDNSKLGECRKNFETSLKCTNELLYSYKDDKGNEQVLLRGIVKTTMKELKYGANNPSYDSICKQLYAYLRAWLVCSIRHQTQDLPIEWIEGNDLTKEDWLDVIDQVTSLFKRKAMEDYLCPESIEEVNKYLGVLKNKIRELPE